MPGSCFSVAAGRRQRRGEAPRNRGESRPAEPSPYLSSFIVVLILLPLAFLLTDASAAVLRLRGPLGNLDVVAVYFPTGAEVLEGDGWLLESLPHLPRSSRSLREAVRRRLADVLLPADVSLTLLAGDFNWVTRSEDRYCLTTSASTGSRDRSEESQWKRMVLDQFQMHELFQPEVTHASAQARSRLDRIYSNQHAADQLDRRIQGAALEWVPHLSAHRAVAASRRRAQFVPEGQRPISEHVVQKREWPYRVALEFQRPEQNHGHLSDIGRLPLLKTAMKNAARHLERSLEGVRGPLSLEDRTGITMKFLRALEHRRVGHINECLTAYPFLASLVRNPYESLGGGVSSYRKVQAHATELARDHALDELGKLHQELPTLSASAAGARRQKNVRLLQRLAPGRGAALQAVRSLDGTVHTNPEGMAGALRTHWEQHFRARPTCQATRQRWIREGRADQAAAARDRRSADWELSRGDMAKAIRQTSQSAPGPDGIPFSAWRAVEELAADVLYKAFRAMGGAGGLAALEQECPNFNESLMVFLPKKADGADAAGNPVYTPENTRPLSITNTDNRLLASAVRLKVEAHLAPEISDMQRGFIGGRSMLSNLVDMDEGMQAAALSEEHASAVLFDFAAAFPSVSREFMHELFESLDWPAWLLQFIRALYHDTTCVISVGGARFGGFRMDSGIRQGCPLSPLLFAVADDILLRRIARALPRALVRAYADDLAVVLPDGVYAAQVLEPMFDEYARVSGLKLHHGKSQWIPLYPVGVEAERARLCACAPAWGDFSISFSAAYLGFVLGPERQAKSWAKALRKYDERAAIWRAIGGGMALSLAAYSTYILPVVSFLAQLDDVPDEWEDHERRAFAHLLPGPRGWLHPDALRGLGQLQCTRRARDFKDFRAWADAAKSRVFNWEALPAGGLRVAARARELRRLRQECAPPDWRAAIWAHWFDSSFLFLLERAEDRVRRAVGGPVLAVASGPQESTNSEMARRQWQRACYQALRPDRTEAAYRHLRRRLDSWAVSVLPGRRAHRAVEVLRDLSTHATPRIFAATLRTLCRGWTTRRRSAACLLQCGRGEDSIEHYANCPVFCRFTCQKLRLPQAAPPDRLLCLSGLAQSTPRDRQVWAIARYALYTAVCMLRHGHTAHGRLEDLLLQRAQEGVRGHPQGMQILSAARAGFP